MASGNAGMKTVHSAPAFAHYPAEFHMSPAVEAHGLVVFSGQTGVRPDGTLSPDPETQIREAFTFLGRNLAAAGLSFDDVIDLTTYHVGLRQHLDTFIRIKDEHIRAPYPAWTAIGITELWTEGSIIEIRATARRPT